MQVIRRKAARALRHLEMRKPERLWLHYCLALTLVFSVITAAHFLSTRANQQAAATAEWIEQNNAQVLLALDIQHQAELVATGEQTSVRALGQAITRFEQAHLSILAVQVGSDRMQQHYFGGAQPLHDSVRSFATIAKQVVSRPLSEKPAAYAALTALYDAGGLQDSMLMAAGLLAEQAAEDATRYNRQQFVIFLLSILLLIVEAAFVFRPAHKLVQATLEKMRRQTTVLRQSQANLKQMNARLEHTVTHNQLTGLPNRTALNRYLEDAIQHRSAAELSLLLVGLDGFKSINETFGHESGDTLLITVSEVLTSCVDEEDLVAHVGGDEYVIVSHEQSRSLCMRIMKALETPFEVRGRRIPIKASIGHLTIGDGRAKPMDIVADAEVALHYAKDSGGNCYHQFSETLRDELGSLQSLQMDLRDAINNAEIEPWFQPQIRLSDGVLHGAEVLARWRHPTRGLLTPDAFLPAAEKAGLMVELDHAVWRAAMRYAADWQSTHVWHPLISLNAAPDTISDPLLIERFLLSLQQSNLDATQVVVEVLETTLIDGKDDMAAINIDSLAECGIALELDDFGTGYASLSKLTQLPLTGLKLDRSLVSPLPDQGADSIIRAILALAGELGLQVIAEGVEENTQATHLNDRGCTFGQGYGFGKPMPPAEFTEWLAANANRAVQAGPDIAQSA